MAFFFGDGFDLYSTITDCGSYWDGSFGGTATLALSANGRFAGSRSIQTNINNNTPYITKTSSVNDAVHHISVAYQQTSALAGANANFFVTLFDGATAQCSICFVQNGGIVLTSGATTGTTLATYAGAVTAINTWFQFEIEVVINNTTGSISVRKNGNTSNDFTLGSLNTRNSTNNYANKIGIGCGVGAGIGNVVDDLLWRSDPTSVPWVGDIRCFTRMPASDAAVQWTPSGSAVPLTPFVAGNTATSSTTQARYQPFTPASSGTIATLSISLNAANAGNVKCTIFASSGSVPTTILGSATTLTGLAIGNNTFTFGTPVPVVAGTQYWVAFMTDTAATNTWNCTSTNPGLNNTPAGGYAAFPIANPPGTSIAPALIFTVNIAPTGGTNYAFVADITQDAATSYVYSSTVGQSDRYGIAAIGSTPASIVGVTTRGYFQKSDAGTRNVAVQLQSGATNVQSASTALNTAWGWISRTDLVDPATGSAWTATGVNNAQIGAVVTA